MALFLLIKDKLDENNKLVYSEKKKDYFINSKIVKIPKNLIRVSKQDLLRIERMRVNFDYFYTINLTGTSMDLSKIESLSKLTVTIRYNQ